MSYQVLARKWRPGKFSELVGQEHVVSAISNALDNDRLHHAYLFTGTRGVGKTTIARIFSKSLNCEEGQGANPCGQCNTCKEIEQGNYVDLLEIDAASRTKVEDTRELLDNVQYKPTRGRYKVYLIDEVHMLSKHSFNALLKTLEEPPPHVKFLLATTDPQKLPITILSRCLQFNLKAMSREQIVGQLQHILEHEQLPFEPQALALLARAAQGSMRDALSLTDQAIAQGGNQVLASVVTDMLGLMDKNQLLKVVHAVVSKSPADVLQLVNDIAEQAPDYDNVHGELASLLHQIALTQWVPEACKLETTSAKAIYQLAKTIPAEQVQLLYQIALQGRKDLPFAADGKSAFEMTLMRMMSFAPSTPIQNTSSEIENGRSEHSLPIEHASSSGGPGNVSKQEEAPLSETSATSKQEQAPSEIPAEPIEEQVPSSTAPSVDTNSSVDSRNVQHVGDTASDTTTQNSTSSMAPEQGSEQGPEPAPAVELDTQDVSLQSETARKTELAEPPEPPGTPTTFKQEQPQHHNALQSDEPPLDAYMDDMPPPSDEDGYFDVGHHQNGIEAIGHDSENSQVGSEHIASVHSENNVHNEGEAAPSLTAEEQLISTADMLALRQKLKQRKAQDADAKSGSAANAKSESASDIQARFTKSKAEAANVAQADSAQLEATSANNNELENSHSQEHGQQPHQNSDLESVTEKTQLDTSQTAPSNDKQSLNTRSSSDDKLAVGVNSDSQVNAFNDNASSSPSSETQSAPIGVGSASAFELDEFEEDMPFSNDDVGSQANSAPPIEDAPPWAIDHEGEPVQHIENTSSSSDSFNSGVNTQDYVAEHFEVADERSFTRDPLDFDAPLSSTYDGNLTAYLNDGSKLTHASQIDEWSNLVEQMPVAGLLKQLVLHAAFSRNGNQVSLEIDHSQTHLLNDSAKKQLVDAIHHGLGENVEVNITLGEPSTTPFALQQEIHAMRHAHAHSVIKTDDTIQALLSTFDASVLADTVKAR
ncbi:DNA polymerase III subunit gamma/tau [Alteromonas gracilis]|uniref:DNA polymerase III subunit gamma/tau n=1 Tax=Alteromonas gracilis TaxID=1479524 RepID=UPI0037367749